MAKAEPGAGPSLYLIDGSGYVYRAFHALPRLSTSRGLPTNAALGFANMLAKLLREERPRYTAVVFDAPGETFRDSMYADYKQNRPTIPDELRPQIGYIRRIVDAFRLPVLEIPGVEADDVIGTLAAQASAAGLEAVLGPLFVELEFHSLLGELVPAGEIPEVDRCAVGTPEEVAAALPALSGAGALAVAWGLDSGRATTAQLTALAVAAPTGPVQVV